MKTPFQATRANALCERFIGSLGRECLDHTLILYEKQLSRVIKEYVDFYNLDRSHRGIHQQVPGYIDQAIAPNSGKIIPKPILGGLHHSYFRVSSQL